jgi:hypothetical protein
MRSSSQSPSNSSSFDDASTTSTETTGSTAAAVDGGGAGGADDGTTAGDVEVGCLAGRRIDVRRHARRIDGQDEFEGRVALAHERDQIFVEAVVRLLHSDQHGDRRTGAGPGPAPEHRVGANVPDSAASEQQRGGELEESDAEIHRTEHQARIAVSRADDRSTTSSQT